MSVPPRPTVRLGGTSTAIPLLSGPVGPAALATRLPTINGPAATTLVDTYLALIAGLAQTPAPPSAPPAAQQLAVALAVAGWRTDRNTAIANFQRTEGVMAPIEVRDGVIMPDGPTWKAIVTYGMMARELEAVRDRPAAPINYIYAGAFNTAVFSTEITTRFGADPVTGAHFTQASLPDFIVLLNLMGRDSRIIDIRWMAYMLATAYWETAVTVAVRRPVMRRGKPVMDATGQPATRAGRDWRTMAPVDETGGGAGRDYHLPVKVKLLPGNKVRITEQDGDQFEVDSDGNFRATSTGASRGSTDNVPATNVYQSDDGTAHAYFGRGYVQLTWWDNYAKASAELGRGFDLLTDPESVKTPAIAYAVMSHGMVTGKGFANGHQMQHYFYGTTANYTGARAMVNSRDPQPVIVAAARIFEAALLAARP